MYCERRMERGDGQLVALRCWPMTKEERPKRELDTPCLVIDIEVLERNLWRMQERVQSAGKRLRPHVKTHKCSQLAKKQIALGASGVCAARLSEAEALANAGIQDILITGPIVTADKMHRLAELSTRVGSVMVVVDHPDNIRLLDRVLKKRGVSIDVLLDVDVGMHRTGVKPSEVREIGRLAVLAPKLNLRGIQAYAGQVQHIQSYHERKLESQRCMQVAVRAFRELQSMAPGCDIFSASGTGTYDIDSTVPEITELQAGSYVFMDSEYLDIGSAEDVSRFVAFDPALRVLTTVVSVNQKGFVTVDAGMKSLYHHGGAPRPVHGENSELTYDWFGDENGRISSHGCSELPTLGAVLELVTSHCDPTVNLYDHYTLTSGDKVLGTWEIDLRGCSQ